MAPQIPSDERYRLLVDAVMDYAIYLLDANGLVSSWNPGAERFKGYAEHEILGQHFSVFYTEEDRAAARPSAPWKRHCALDGSKPKAGGCARMAAASGAAR